MNLKIPSFATPFTPAFEKPAAAAPAAPPPGDAPAAKASSSASSFAASGDKGGPDWGSFSGGGAPASTSFASSSSVAISGQPPQVEVTTLGDGVAMGDASSTQANGFNERVSGTSIGNPTRSQWGGETPLLQQRGNADCGETVAAMLKGAKDGAGSVSGANGQRVMDDFARLSHGDGTTPQEMGDMLASEGMQVKRSSNTLDANALGQALKNGDKGAVMLDSSKLPGGGGNGQAHWVVVDGIDGQGNFQVKDPASGSSYSLSPQQLEDAVSTSQSARQSGGMLIVGTPDRGESLLGGVNAWGTEVLGNAPGTGSNWRRLGRESSEG